MATSRRQGFVEGARRVRSFTRSNTQARRPAPNIRVQREASDYNRMRGGPSIDHRQYILVNVARARRIAKAYERLPVDDSANPVVQTAYEAFAAEVNEQWDFAVARGMRFEPAPDGIDPYRTSVDMADDVRQNRRLFFYQGGEAPNKFLASTDDKTGYTINDKFRAVHDYFGHCAGGFGFGARGEENAWNAHSQMFSAEARRALTTETRGQNSYVNFGQHNFNSKGRYLDIPPTQRPYAPQKSALLPDEFVRRPQEAIQERGRLRRARGGTLRTRARRKESSSAFFAKTRSRRPRRRDCHRIHLRSTGHPTRGQSSPDLAVRRRPLLIRRHQR